jgi:type IV pilus assembly protein PilA
MNIQKRSQQGFTLIELMIVIAIVGILAAIALPAYQDYVVRAKMSEPAAALAEAKTSLAEYYSSNNRFPPDTGKGGLNTNPNKQIVTSLKYVSNGQGLGAIITAELATDVIPSGGSTIYGFSLSSITKNDGSIEWICTTSVKAGTSTAVADNYLPSNCRN